MLSGEFPAMTDDELLTMVQEASFHYYWDGAHPVSGMARENLPCDDRIIDACVDASFPMLRKMGNKLERLEDDIFEGEHSSEVVRDISNVKQEIINFRRVVRPQRAALKDLEATKRYIPDDLEIYFDDINDASERTWDMLENYKEVVEALESTNEAVLSHRLNDTFRVLTAISVIVLPLTLIASIWGMNTRVPGEGSHAGFFAVVGVMVIVLVATIMLFKRRGWL